MRVSAHNLYNNLGISFFIQTRTNLLKIKTFRERFGLNRNLATKYSVPFVTKTLKGIHTCASDDFITLLPVTFNTLLFNMFQITPEYHLYSYLAHLLSYICMTMISLPRSPSCWRLLAHATSSAVFRPAKMATVMFDSFDLYPIRLFSHGS